MRQVRLNNDIHFSWTLDRGDGQPFSLSGRNLRLWMSSGALEFFFDDFTIDENGTIHWTFLGKDQYKLGVYKVVLCENYGQSDQVTIDEAEGVELVSRTAAANGELDEADGVDVNVRIVTQLKTELYSGVAEEVYQEYVLPVITPFLEMQVLISDVDFAALEEAGEVDPNKIYYIYEAEEE